MTYTEFLNCKHEFAFIQLYRVTYEEDRELKVAVAEWEDSNFKWYVPEPFEDRKEMGYADIFGRAGKIIDIARFGPAPTDIVPRNMRYDVQMQSDDFPNPIDIRSGVGGSERFD